jgi:hypothetical protein
MFTKIKREEALLQYSNFPHHENEDNFFYPSVFKNYLLTIDSKSVKGHATLISTALTRLIRGMEFDSLIFIGDSNIPWLKQDNNYPPVKTSFQFFQENGVGRKFNGALKIRTPLLTGFTKHLFWLIRCNANLPSIHFSDPAQQVLISICKYGNIHFDTLNKTIDDLFMATLDKSGLKQLEHLKCYDPFTTNGKIKGRQQII